MSAVVRIARTWLCTPFVEGASVRGVGADCAGLIEGIARELGVAYPTRQAAKRNFVQAASQVLIQSDHVQSGALILLAKDPGGPPIHAAIATDTGTIIHAHWRAGVVENTFGNWFTARTTHIFAWPETPSSTKDF